LEKIGEECRMFNVGCWMSDWGIWIADFGWGNVVYGMLIFELNKATGWSLSFQVQNLSLILSYALD